MATIQPLKNSPLVEAIFEIRHDPIDNVADSASILNNRLKDYSEFEDLNVPQLPKEIPETSGIVRFRFRNPDRTRLYQMGTGVLSVNVLKYTTFTHFRGEIEKVLKEHQSIVSVPHVKRLGLRYINKIKLNGISPDKILKLNCETPKDFPNAIGWNGQFLFNIEGNQIRVITNFSADSQELILDIDCFLGGIFPYKTNDIGTWIDSAHEKVEDFFLKAITDSYLKDIS